MKYTSTIGLLCWVLVCSAQFTEEPLAEFEEECFGEERYQCKDGKCIFQYQYCDGRDDCDDGSDESMCLDESKMISAEECSKRKKFMCADGKRCLPKVLVCDGELDCDDDSDERNCDKHVDKDAPCKGFKCRSDGKCISPVWTCDGAYDCDDRSDEDITTTCQQFKRVTLKDDKSNLTLMDWCYPCLDNSYCLRPEYMCNGVPDCRDHSDEGTFCEHWTVMCVGYKCDVGNRSICRSERTGPTCECPEYTKYNRTAHKCEPFDSCLDPDPACSQGCEDKGYGPYLCTCDYGYKSDRLGIGVACFASDPEPLMFYTTANEIRYIRVKSHDMKVIKTGSKQPHGVVFDGNHIYWIELAKGHQAIVRAKLLNANETKETLISLGLEDPGSLAIDYVTGHLYFTDAERGTINACTLNASQCTIVHSYCKNPRFITLHVKMGTMYWADWHDHPVIMASSMDGSNATILTDKLKKMPTSLAIDAPGNRLYFVDDGGVKVIRVQGGDIFHYYEHRLHRPYAVNVFENNVFVSEWSSNTIVVMPKLIGMQTKEDLFRVNVSVAHIHIYHPLLTNRTTRPNPCENSTCSHICLLRSSTEYGCACPTHMHFKPMFNNTCIENPNYRPQYLVVGNENNFTRIEYNMVGNPEAFATQFDIGRVQAMAYDNIRSVLYLFDGHHKSLNYIAMEDFHKGQTHVLFRYGLNNVIAMDFDYLTSVLYILDAGRHTIDVVSLKTMKRAILFRFSEHFISMAVMPDFGRLLVALKNEVDSAIRIDSIGLDGSDRKTIVANDLRGPRVILQYFQPFNVVYFSDESTGIIDIIHPTGYGRSNFVEPSTTVTGLALTDPYAFWTDRHSFRIYWTDIHESTPKIRRMELNMFPNTTHLHILATKPLPILPLKSKPHPCDSDPCEEICVQTPHEPNAETLTFKCVCSPGLVNVNNKCVDTIECKFGEAYCHFSNACIKKSQMCDGVKDCANGEDEEGCQIVKPSQICLPHQYICNGTCISKDFSCLPDVQEPLKCTEMQFKCEKDAICIDRAQLCDGNKDCPDGTDEASGICNLMNCLDTEYMCTSGQCILATFRCDGETDCIDGSDEQHCVSTVCRDDEFVCIEQRNCIKAGQVCDGSRDCSDGSDEEGCLEPDYGDNAAFVEGENCPEGEFACHLNRSICLPLTVRCDEKPDCPGNTDELDCDYALYCYGNKKLFRCKESPNHCLKLPRVCDGNKDCGDGSDEDYHACLMVNRTLKLYPMVYREECYDGYHCSSGQCIEWGAVCSGTPDCNDVSDEGPQCETACKDNPCHGDCVPTPRGPQCKCPTGFTLADDQHSCDDVDECAEDACAQICHNTPGSYLCACYREFAIGYDRRSCKTTKGHMAVLYVSGNSIRATTADGKSTVEYTTNMDIDDIDYNFRLNKLYITSAEAGKLVEADTNTKHEVVITNVGRPTKIAVDWVRNNVYFVDSTPSAQFIRVCDVANSNCARLHKLPNAQVTALVVDPAHHKMFYCVTKDSESVIWSASLAGHMVADIATVHNCTGLAVDHRKKVLYVAESGPAHVLRMDQDGGQQKLLMSDDRHLESPHDLAIFEDHIYYLVANSFKLSRCKLYEAKKCEPYLQRAFDANTFVIRHESVQPDGIDDMCKQSKCEHMCVLDLNGLFCICDDGSMERDGECPNAAIAQLPLFNGLYHRHEPNSVGKIIGYLLMALLIVFAATIAVRYYLRRRRQRERLPYAQVHFRNRQSEEPTNLFNFDLSPEAPESPAIDMPSEHSSAGSRPQEFWNPMQRVIKLFRGPTFRRSTRSRPPSIVIEPQFPEDVSDTESDQLDRQRILD